MSTGSFKTEGKTNGFVWAHYSFSFLTIVRDLYPVNVVVMVLIHVPGRT